MFLMFLLPATATEYYFETARVLAGESVEPPGGGW
jgi:hypothetical protein